MKAEDLRRKGRASTRLAGRTHRSMEVISTDLVLDEGGEREIVEEISKVSPHIRVAIFPQAFVIEAVHLGNLSRFMVAAEDRNPVAVAKLEGDKEGDCLYGVISSVDVIAHEKVVCVGRVAADAKQLRKIMLHIANEA